MFFLPYLLLGVLKAAALSCWAQEGRLSRRLCWGLSLHSSVPLSGVPSTLSCLGPPIPELTLGSPFLSTLVLYKVHHLPQKGPETCLHSGAGDLRLDLVAGPHQAPEPPVLHLSMALTSFSRNGTGWAGWDPMTVPTKLPSCLQTFVLSTELQKMQSMLLMSSLFG